MTDTDTHNIGTDTDIISNTAPVNICEGHRKRDL